MLTIQKLVLLLDAGHLEAFGNYLAQTGNALPLKLIENIARYGEQQPDSELLCKDIYGDADDKSKGKFFQLAHYSFRLSSFLAKRYPFYLSHNLQRIEEQLNRGEIDRAVAKAELLLDIASKIEDFHTQTWTLKLLINFSHIKEKRKEAIRMQQLLNKSLENEKTLNEIYLYIREHLNFKDKRTITAPNTRKHVAFFGYYHDHPSFPVRILSRYGSCYSASFLEDKKFYAEEIRKDLAYLNSELEKHSYVIFPFADDVLINIDYLLLKHQIKQLNEEGILREASRLTKKWNALRFWQPYINTAQIVSLSLQASHFITHYCVCYRENYTSLIPSHISEMIEETRQICEAMLEQMKDEKEAHVRLINLHNIYCTLLLFGGPSEIARAARILENLMINYQQIPFQKLYDALFVNLILAYFSLGQHNEVSECYRRYEKLTAKKVKVEENDITIKAFYYVSQWLQTKRDQYVEKLDGLLRDTSDNSVLHSTHLLMLQLAEYYELPIKRDY